jgi:DNA polymerase III gamma/tau subunit
VELYKRYRPKTLENVMGQDTAVRSLSKMIEKGKVPQALMFIGPSGVGKTTLARILRKPLGCHPSAFTEVNCADIRGIENIRDIRSRMGLRPMQGDSKIWLIDECHKLTNDAQNALLKMLEDTPENVYFILCTTDPHKVIKTVRTRCTEITLKPIGNADLSKLLYQVAEDEGAFQGANRGFPKSIEEKIVENSEGSARKALVLLDAIINLDSEKDMLAALERIEQAQGIQLCRLLLPPRPSWKDVSKLLKELEKEDPEELRLSVMGYMRSVLLSGGPIAQRAAFIMGVFERNFYDSGRASLALACWEACTGK